jgi:NifU-like protein involved in Fe-S cluster formation
LSSDPRYSDEVLRRFRTAPGAGDVPPGPHAVYGRAGDREQGAEVVFGFSTQDGRVVDARFRAFGCPHFLAGASWLTERLRGAGRADLLAWDWREAAAALAVPAAKFGRLLTLQDAIRDAAGNWPGQPGSRV